MEEEERLMMRLMLMTVTELRRQPLILMLMSPAIWGAPAMDRFCASHVT